MIPVIERREDRHVVGLEHVETWREDICKLTFVNENSGLAFAHGKLGTVFDFVAFALEPPDHRVACVICPMNDVDEFACQKIENTHGFSPSIGKQFNVFHDRGPRRSAASWRMIGRAASSVIPVSKRGS